MPTSRSSSLLVVLVTAAVLIGLGWLAHSLFQHEPKPGPSSAEVVPAAKPPKTEPLPTPAVAPPAPVRSPVAKTKAERPDGPNVESGDPGQISGRVVTPDGTPVAQAEVELATGPAIGLQIPGMRTPTGDVQTTDANGHFTFATVDPSDDYLLLASHADYGNSEAGPIVVKAKEKVEVGDIRLTQGMHAWGTVTSGGRPLAGAVVELDNAMKRLKLAHPNVPDSKDFEPFTQNTSTDSQGRYEFKNVPIQSFELTASMAGYARITKSNATFLAAPREQQMDFELATAKTIAGMIVDGEHHGIPEAKVSASIANEATFRCESEAVTDSSGHFRIENLAPGQYFLRAECDGFSDGNKNQVPADSNDIEIQLLQQGIVDGFVVDEETGNPMPDFDLTVLQSLQGRQPGPTRRPRQHVHDSSGRFELKGFDPGRYTLQASVAAYADSQSNEFEVRRGEKTSGVRIAMNRGGGISGRVVDHKGQAVGGGLLLVRTNQYKDNPVNQLFKGFGAGDPELKMRVNSDGTFKLELIVPGTYQVSIRHPQFAQFEMNDVEIVKGQTRDLGPLELSNGARISGHAYDENGGVLAGATINATSSTNNFVVKRTDNEGLFAFPNLPAGDWTLAIGDYAMNPPDNPLIKIVKCSGSRTKPVPAAEGDDLNVDLRLAIPPKKPK